MSTPPTLATDRLLLRAFRPSDAETVHELVSAYEIALNTISIPHPYPEGAAAQWIATHPGRPDDHVFAITRRDDGALVGCIGIHVQPDHDRAELGYWIGVPYWGAGYATEAGRAVVAWGFESLGLNRIFAEHFTRNPASGAVMRNLGMKPEGTLRRHVRKWDEYVDVVICSVLCDEWRDVTAL
jgi:RimJ/RimL family protein N-acetyltransferase